MIWQDIKVLVLLQKGLSLADNVQIWQVKKYFFIASGCSLSIRVPKQLAESAHSQPLNLPENIICANLQCNADFWDHPLGETEPSQRVGWVSHYLHKNSDNSGRWQISKLSQVEGHSPRNTGVWNVTSKKDSPLGSVLPQQSH